MGTLVLQVTAEREAPSSHVCGCASIDQQQFYAYRMVCFWQWPMLKMINKNQCSSLTLLSVMGYHKWWPRSTMARYSDCEYRYAWMYPQMTAIGRKHWPSLITATHCQTTSTNLFINHLSTMIAYDATKYILYIATKMSLRHCITLFSVAFGHFNTSINTDRKVYCMILFKYHKCDHLKISIYMSAHLYIWPRIWQLWSYCW